MFEEHYPEQPHKLAHRLDQDARLSLDGLATLAEQLPCDAIEYNRGDLPIGIEGKPGTTGLSIGDTIRHIATSNSWAVLKYVEQVSEYKTLLMDLLAELRPAIEAKTGELLTPQAFAFISSPNAVTPYHFDPEHNILLQLRGTKVMTQFPAGNTRYAADEIHERFHLGGERELRWREEFADGGTEWTLGPGEAVYVPVMAPHFVRNGSQSSISLSITWRSEWSYGESDARCLNATLRRVGFSPRAPARWPASNRTRSTVWRVLRRARSLRSRRRSD